MLSVKPILRITMLVLFATALVAGQPVSAQTQGNPAAPQLTPRPVEKKAPADALLEMPLEDLSPRLREMRELLENEKQALTELRAQYAAATDETEALRVQRQIHELKRGTEAGMLQIQLKHARLDGNDLAVAHLEDILSEINTSAKVETPQDRPDPGQNR